MFPSTPGPETRPGSENPKVKSNDFPSTPGPEPRSGSQNSKVKSSDLPSTPGPETRPNSQNSKVKALYFQSTPGSVWWAEKQPLKMGKVPPETSPRIPAELCSPDLLPEAKFCRKSPVVRQDFESPKAPGGGSNTDVARAARATIRLRERERERERARGKDGWVRGRWAATKMYPYTVFLVTIWAGRVFS